MTTYLDVLKARQALLEAQAANNSDLETRELDYYSTFYRYADQYLLIDTPTAAQEEEYDEACKQYADSFTPPLRTKAP